MKLSKLYDPLLALISGLLLTLSFAPLHLYPLAFIAISSLFYLWSKNGPIKAFYYGLIFGGGFFSSGVYWIYIAIHQFGHAPVSLSMAMTAAMILLLSLFVAINGWLINWLFSRSTVRQKTLCLYPASWVLFEWLRAHALLNGFPWLLLGYSQTMTTLDSFAPWCGVFGLSLMVCFISGCITCFFYQPNHSQKVKLATAILAIYGVAVILQPLHFTQTKQSQHIIVMQGNIEQSIKWDPEQLHKTLTRYYRLTQQVKQPSLIIWPEGAVPTYPEQIPDYIQSLQTLLDKTHSSLLFGTQLLDSTTQRAYNGLFLMGQSQGEYRKQHLVPFGEYYPLRSLAQPILTLLHMPGDGFASGSAHQAPLRLNHFLIAPFICYEIAYPNLVLQQTRGKQLIIVISDDSWFGDSIALDQQLQMTQMRAMETQRYTIAGNNTGITAIIDPKGRIIKTAALDQVQVISATIQAMDGNTPLMHWGYWPVWILSLLLLCLPALKQRRH